MSLVQVDFYLVEGRDPMARLRTACRLAEKACEQGQRTVVRASDDAEAAQVDELLWTFSDQSFVPHAVWPQDASGLEGSTVLVAAGALPPTHRDVLINLAADVPAQFNEFARLLEIVGAEEPERQAGRLRWRQYREAGAEPKSHTVADRAHG